MIKLEVWVLTREINQYDQDGEYFMTVFGDKPTPNELLCEGVPEETISWVLQGGGRMSIEDEWWHLKKQTINVPESAVPKVDNAGWVTSSDGLTRTKVAPDAAAPAIPSERVTLNVGYYGPSKFNPR